MSDIIGVPSRQPRNESSTWPARPAATRDTVPAPDLVCLSHLRWDFVFQRPQHLLTRFARDRRVFFVEEPIWHEDPSDATERMEVSPRSDTLWVATPRLPRGLGETEAIIAQRELLDRLLREHDVLDPVLWYYTPMALPFSRHIAAGAVVYDCMDELSAFAGAHPALARREAELFARADVVFTGGQSLYEAKRTLHTNIHAFPSSIDADHFRQARAMVADPADQASIGGPRLGFFGVVDERMDLELIDGVAASRPDWQILLIGPVVKIDPAVLPRRPNLHYLGPKKYAELPSYLAGWDVALLPFARNDSTRFISPTKTPEYLAAGKPVVSTSIRDVVRPYGEQKLVEIADTVDAFVDACERALQQAADATWLQRVDRFLSRTSWDRTWGRMNDLVAAVAPGRTRQPAVVRPARPRVAARSFGELAAGEQPA